MLIIIFQVIEETSNKLRKEDAVAMCQTNLIGISRDCIILDKNFQDAAFPDGFL